MSVGDIIGVPGAPVLNRPAVLSLFAELEGERDRARELAAALEQVCAERERLLWLAIGTPTSKATEEEIGRQIARHLRETGARPPSEVRS